MKYLLYSLMFFTVSTTIQAQTKWSVDECMRYAIENCPELHRQEAQNKIYNYNYQEALAGLVPTLGAKTSLEMNFGRGLGEENTYTDINSINNNYNLESSMVLFAGLSKITQIKIQKVSKLMGRNQLEQIKDDIAYKVMELYYNATYYKKTIHLANKQYESRTEQLNQIKRMEEMGLKSATDVAEFEAQQAADKLLLIRQNNLYTIEIIRLKEKMNYPIDQDLEMSDSIVNELITSDNEEALVIFQQAQSFLPKALVLENTKRVQELRYNQSFGRLFPSITAYGGVSTKFFRYMDGSEYMPFKEQLRERRGQYIGVGLSIPIFQNLSKSSELRRAKQQLNMVKSDNDLALRAMHSEIEQAIADKNGLVEEYQQAQKQFNAKNLAHKQNVRKYEEGLISALEVNISANRLLEASIDCLKAMYRYQVKCRLVNYYKGEPFIR